MAGGLKVEVIGVVRFKDRMARKDRRTALEIRRALEFSGLDVVDSARRMLRDGSRTGNPYVRYKPRRTGIAGKKGVEPPKWDEGTLGGSIFLEPAVPVDHVKVGTRLDYGKHLEKNGWRWLGPAFNRVVDRINLRFRNAMRNAR